jgi:hypothetical protein
MRDLVLFVKKVYSINLIPLEKAEKNIQSKGNLGH